MSRIFDKILGMVIVVMIAVTLLLLASGLIAAAKRYPSDTVKLDLSVYQCTEQLDVVERKNRLINKVIVPVDVKKTVCIKYEHKMENKAS
jgi:hypothetical protein